MTFSKIDYLGEALDATQRARLKELGFVSVPNPQDIRVLTKTIPPRTTPKAAKTMARRARVWGWTLRKISNYLAQHGHLNQNNQPYGAESIRLMLDNTAPTTVFTNTPLEILQPDHDYHVSAFAYAEAIQILKDGGLSQVEIALVLDKKEGWISFTSRVNDLPPNLIEQVKLGMLSVTDAVKSVRPRREKIAENHLTG